MMVRLLTDRTGRGFYQREGEIHDLSTDEANAMIRTRQAELVETTTLAAPETAARNLKKLSRR